MDLTIDIDESSRINIRTAGIIVHNDKMLLHNNLNHPYYALIGGREKFMENAYDAVKREFEEELGYEFFVEKHLTTIENYYYHKEKKVQEIEFIFKLEFKDDKMKNCVETLFNKEGKDNLQYEWVDISDIPSTDIRPAVIKDFFENNSSYLINSEIDVK